MIAPVFGSAAVLGVHSQLHVLQRAQNVQSDVGESDELHFDFAPPFNQSPVLQIMHLLERGQTAEAVSLATTTLNRGELSAESASLVAHLALQGLYDIPAQSQEWGLLQGLLNAGATYSDASSISRSQLEAGLAYTAYQGSALTFGNLSDLHRSLSDFMRPLQDNPKFSDDGWSILETGDRVEEGGNIFGMDGLPNDLDGLFDSLPPDFENLLGFDDAEGPHGPDDIQNSRNAGDVTKKMAMETILETLETIAQNDPERAYKLRPPALAL